MYLPCKRAKCEATLQLNHVKMCNVLQGGRRHWTVNYNGTQKFYKSVFQMQAAFTIDLDILNNKLLSY